MVSEADLWFGLWVRNFQSQSDNGILKRRSISDKKAKSYPKKKSLIVNLNNRTSNIANRTSQNRKLSIVPRISHIANRTSSIVHRQSYIVNRTS